MGEIRAKARNSKLLIQVHRYTVISEPGFDTTSCGLWGDHSCTVAL
mgnify:CR=1 FL=1